MAFIAGSYTITFGGNSLGQLEDKTLSLEIVYQGEVIRGDFLSQSIQDWVYNGGDCFMQFTCLEAEQTGVKLLTAPYTTGDQGAVGTPGVFASDYSAALVLTKRTGPNASPLTITCNSAILAPGYPVNLLLGNTLKRVPIRLQLLPTLYSDSKYRWFKPAYS
jgi:hypothetical protein